ncbi:AIM24 family protein [Arthrobacter sp. Soc17.1.1.1]|uniref:AIM24 family protein n=1 Tax=Arthrobacter sp. Soc17.1.1.1 TaxID=3121277 RepID=UPI002FE46EBE
MRSTISGTSMPVLELVLEAGEKVIAEGGDIGWLTPGFEMDTSSAHGGGGGFMGGLKRALGGGQLFLTEYTAPAAGGRITFAASLPGTIREVPLSPDTAFMVQSGSYMASTAGVDVSVGVQKKLGAGIFGGVGVVFQALSGTGTTWLQLAGELTEVNLAAGETLLIHPGHLAMYPAGMTLEFATVKGVKNKIFGDSLFLAEVHGPATIWLQSMTPAALASAIQPYLPRPTSSRD